MKGYKVKYPYQERNWTLNARCSLKCLKPLEKLVLKRLRRSYAKYRRYDDEEQNCTKMMLLGMKRKQADGKWR